MLMGAHVKTSPSWPNTVQSARTGMRSYARFICSSWTKIPGSMSLTWRSLEATGLGKLATGISRVPSDVVCIVKSWGGTAPISWVQGYHDATDTGPLTISVPSSSLG